MQAGKRTIFSLLFSTIFFIAAQAQTIKLSGKVLNEKNEPVTSVSIKISGTNMGATTDGEGRFSLNLEPGKKYQLEISAIGYEAKTITDVEVIAGQLNELNLTLNIKVKSGENVIITAKSSVRKETVNAAISFQKNTNTVAQIISAETIRRAPDRTTSEILKRVPGTSVQDGKYLIVRGLSDRYNQAMLNGILLSSTEPDRKTFSFDIFPAAVIDNITINKAFIPELPGEWGGGLVQVNTKDIPSQNFLTVQLGTGFNTNVAGRDFYQYKGSNLDWLGFDNKTRALPSGIPLKSTFDQLSDNEKIVWAKKFPNNWAANKIAVSPNTSLQIGGGLNTKLFGKKFGVSFALNYNRSLRHQDFKNSFFSIANNKATADFIYYTDRYSQDVLLGGMANFAMQFNNNNKITVRNIINVNTTDFTSLRTGTEYISGVDNVRSRELGFRTNTFYNTQVSGDHYLPKLKTRFTWYGSFNILDQYIPSQRRVEYIQTNQVGPFEARISTGQSQKSGSILYGNLSDYIYTAGGDINKSFILGGKSQSVKMGYFLQVKDRLFDTRPFFVKLYDNSLKTLSEDQLFASSNFAPGKLGFDEFIGNQYRYLANSIMNAGFLQFDNMLTSKLRVVWGARYEYFDQVVGSMKKSDPRFVHSEKGDLLPAINFTYKLNSRTNIRLAGSKTVVRPEFRELSDFAFYDFELGATVLGNRNLVRTQLLNADLRYEIYPRPGELFTFGVFYKYFQKPIELYFNQSGAGSSNTFNYLNADYANGYGVEFEMRKRLDFSSALKNFTFTSNLSYIYNRVRSASTSLDRPMQGQSPYLVNAGLQFDQEKKGISSTLLFNIIGKRIAYVGNDQVPAIWENPRPLLDYQFAKKILKTKGELKLNVSDILNKRAIFYHDINDDGKYGMGKDALAVQRKFGTTFTITFGYNFK